MSDASTPNRDTYGDASTQSTPLLVTLSDASDAEKCTNHPYVRALRAHVGRRTKKYASLRHCVTGAPA